MKPGAIVHVELLSNDPAASRKFLEAVFDWKFTKMDAPPGMDYWTWKAAAEPAGGLTRTMNGMPPSTLNHILVESVSDTVKKIKTHGGKILRSREEVPKIGWFAVFEMPGGVVQAIFEPMREG